MNPRYLNDPYIPNTRRMNWSVESPFALPSSAQFTLET